MVAGFFRNSAYVDLLHWREARESALRRIRARRFVDEFYVNQFLSRRQQLSREKMLKFSIRCFVE